MLESVLKWCELNQGVMASHRKVQRDHMSRVFQTVGFKAGLFSASH